MTDETTRRLRSTLEQLSSEIDRIDTLDDDSRQEIAGLVAKLQARLGGDSGAAMSEDDESITEKLEELEQGFQTRHPTIAGLLLQAVEALRQLGI